MIIHYLGLFIEKLYIIQKLKIEKDNFFRLKTFKLTQYIVELNNAYLSAKSYLGIE